MLDRYVKKLWHTKIDGSVTAVKIALALNLVSCVAEAPELHLENYD